MREVLFPLRGFCFPHHWRLRSLSRFSGPLVTHKSTGGGGGLNTHPTSSASPSTPLHLLISAAHQKASLIGIIDIPPSLFRCSFSLLLGPFLLLPRPSDGRGRCAFIDDGNGIFAAVFHQGPRPRTLQFAAAEAAAAGRTEEEGKKEQNPATAADVDDQFHAAAADIIGPCPAFLRAKRARSEPPSREGPRRRSFGLYETRPRPSVRPFVHFCFSVGVRLA